MHIMFRELGKLLPLGKFRCESVLEGTKLHHFGELDAAKHSLDRPIWVSDQYSCAYQYKNFTLPAPRYTSLIVGSEFRIVNLNGVGLQPIAKKLKVFNHGDWNKHLSEHLLGCGLSGLVYAGREILIAAPEALIKDMESIPC